MKCESVNLLGLFQALSAWMDWVIKKTRTFDQRGEMVASAWAEQQMLNMNLRARRAAKDKEGPTCKSSALPNFAT
jgi:hypothetical protein